MSERIRGSYDDALYKSTYTLQLSTHADRQGVDISFTVCFVCLFVCLFVRLRISPSRIKLASDVKFCTAVHSASKAGNLSFL